MEPTYKDEYEPMEYTLSVTISEGEGDIIEHLPYGTEISYQEETVLDDQRTKEIYRVICYPGDRDRIARKLNELPWVTSFTFTRV